MRILKVQVKGPLPKRRGSKLEYPEKTPDNQSENRYHIISEVENHHLNQGSKPHPLTLMIFSFNPLNHWLSSLPEQPHHYHWLAVFRLNGLYDSLKVGSTSEVMDDFTGGTFA